jgi:hypothetical protein
MVWLCHDLQGWFKGYGDVDRGASGNNGFPQFLRLAKEMDALLVLRKELAFGHDFPEGVFPIGDSFDFDDFCVGDEVNSACDGEGFHDAAKFFAHA